MRGWVLKGGIVVGKGGMGNEVKVEVGRCIICLLSVGSEERWPPPSHHSRQYNLFFNSVFY